jgi:hypothetical protein
LFDRHRKLVREHRELVHDQHADLVLFVGSTVRIAGWVKQRRPAIRNPVADRGDGPVLVKSMRTKGGALQAPSSASARTIGALRELSAVLAPVTVLTGLLYFFGYLRARAFYGFFGIDLRSIGFSTTDYLAQSADTVFRPLAVLLAIGLGAVLLHIGLTITLDQADATLARRMALGLACLAMALLLAGITDLAFVAIRVGNLLLAPIALIGGAVCLEYAVQILAAPKVGSARTRRLLKRTSTARRGLVIALVIFAAFWATSDVADSEGRSAARLVADSLLVQTKVHVYSRDRLQIVGSGVQVTNLQTTNSAYRFRYDGLRLLLHSGDRWFLVRAVWDPENGEDVIVLQDNPSELRIEVAP